MAIKKKPFKVVEYKPGKSVNIKSPKAIKSVKAIPVKVKISPSLKHSSGVRKIRVSAAKSDIKN
jgi:hypothetical protein